MGSYDLLKADKKGFDIWKHSTRDVFFYKDAAHGSWGVSTKLCSGDQRIFIFIKVAFIFLNLFYLISFSFRIYWIRINITTLTTLLALQIALRHVRKASGATMMMGIG